MPNSKEDVFKKINMHDGDVSLCWEWKGGVGSNGRPSFTVNGKKILAYRLTYELMIGPIPKGHVLRHTCDNKICCNPFHGETGTHQENMNDMKERERHGLPHNTVKAIKRLLTDNRKHEDIAKLYGISRQLVTAINGDKVYSHVKKEETNG